jgi:hypothetical protein
MASIGPQWPKFTECGQNWPTQKMIRLKKAQNQPKIIGNGQEWPTMTKYSQILPTVAQSCPSISLNGRK